MSSKPWIVVIAVAAVLLVNNLHIFGSSGFAGFIDFLLTLFIIYRAYILYKKAMPVIHPIPGPAQPKGIYQPVWQAKVAVGPYVRSVSGSTAGQLWIVVLIVVLVFIFAGYQLVGAGGYNFFVWGDNLLGTGNGNLPILMWALAGLLLGTVTGSLVIWRKYHIKFYWCLGTIIPFLGLLAVLQGLSAPLQSIVPRPMAMATDSAQTSSSEALPPAVKPKRRYTAKTVPREDTPARVGSAAEPCVSQLAAISIHARADSVTVYYRTASYRNGPWSEWKTKFIPQQGQFLLTDEGKVRANSLQYYYEAKSALTRSAQDPYTRLLCDGALIIDTY